MGTISAHDSISVVAGVRSEHSFVAHHKLHDARGVPVGADNLGQRATYTIVMKLMEAGGVARPPPENETATALWPGSQMTLST